MKTLAFLYTKSKSNSYSYSSANSKGIQAFRRLLGPTLEIGLLRPPWLPASGKTSQLKNTLL